MALFGFREWVKKKRDERRNKQEERYEECYEKLYKSWNSTGSKQDISSSFWDKAREEMVPLLKESREEQSSNLIMTAHTSMMVIASAVLIFSIIASVLGWLISAQPLIAIIGLMIGMLLSAAFGGASIFITGLLMPLFSIGTWISYAIKKMKFEKLFNEIKSSCQDDVATDHTLKIYKEINAKLEKHDRRKHFWGLNTADTSINRATRQTLAQPTMDYLVSQYEHYYNKTLKFREAEDTDGNRQKISESAQNAAKYAKDYDDLFIKRFEQTKNSTRADDIKFREWFKARWQRHEDDSDEEIARNARGMYKHAERVQDAARFPNNSVYRAIDSWQKYEEKRNPAAKKQADLERHTEKDAEHLPNDELSRNDIPGPQDNEAQSIPDDTQSQQPENTPKTSPTKVTKKRGLFGFREWVRKKQEERYEQRYRELYYKWNGTNLTDDISSSFWDKSWKAAKSQLEGRTESTHRTMDSDCDSDCDSDMCSGIAMCILLELLILLPLIIVCALSIWPWWALFAGLLVGQPVLMGLFSIGLGLFAIIDNIVEHVAFNKPIQNFEKLFEDIKNSCKDNKVTDKTLESYKDITAKLEKHDSRKHFWGLNKRDTTVNRNIRHKLAVPTMDYLVSQYEHYYNETLSLRKEENTDGNRQKISKSAQNAAKYAKDYDDLFIKRFEQTKNSTRADDIEFREWFKARWQTHEDDSDAEIARNARGMYKHAERVQAAARFPNNSVYRAIDSWQKYEEKRKTFGENKPAPAATKTSKAETVDYILPTLVEPSTVSAVENSLNKSYVPTTPILQPNIPFSAPRPAVEKNTGAELAKNLSKSYVPDIKPLTPADVEHASQKNTSGDEQDLSNAHKKVSPSEQISQHEKTVEQDTNPEQTSQISDPSQQPVFKNEDTLIFCNGSEDSIDVPTVYGYNTPPYSVGSSEDELKYQQKNQIPDNNIASPTVNPTGHPYFDNSSENYDTGANNAYNLYENNHTAPPYNVDSSEDSLEVPPSESKFDKNTQPYYRPRTNSTGQTVAFVPKDLLNNPNLPPRPRSASTSSLSNQWSNNAAFLHLGNNQNDINYYKSPRRSKTPEYK